MFPVVGDTASGRAIKSLRPERVDSPDELADVVARELWAEHGATYAAVAAPVIVDRALWGAISVSRVTTERFPPEAEDRLGEFAGLVALAIANAAAQAEVRASRARSWSRRRRAPSGWSATCTTAHSSVSCRSRSRSASRGEAAVGPGGRRELIGAAARGAGVALDELRELPRGIHPAILTDRGLEAALRRSRPRTPVPVELDDLPEGRLPPPVEATAYFVVAESLTNVATTPTRRTPQRRVGRRNGNAVVEVATTASAARTPARVGPARAADRVGRSTAGSDRERGRRGHAVHAEIPCA